MYNGCCDILLHLGRKLDSGKIILSILQVIGNHG